MNTIQKIRKILILLLSLALLCATVTGCSSGVRLNPKNPVTITMWHNYGGQMQNTMDQLIDEFNSTVGKEKGIIVSVTSISAFRDVEEKLRMIAEGDPGAPEMPDITPAYPRNAMLLSEYELIIGLDEQFTEEELGAYLPQFVDEGRLPDGKLYVFPFAKSTEVLFVNQTLFDRFAADTGVTLESLATFEGIAQAAITYARWTDDQTPDIPGDGAAFYTADSWFNIAMVGTKQMGADFVAEDTLRTHDDTHRRVWDFAVQPALSGGFAVVDGYSSDLSKTGEIICSTGSTAGILFYGDSVTYPDNTTEAVTYTVLPYPTFTGGEKIALQRGSGLVVARSTPEKEYAAALFLKWFTQPLQNMRLVASTGYLPVTREAFEKNMKEEIGAIENSNVKRLLEAATQMYSAYDFITAPNYDSFDAMSKEYETAWKEALREGYARVEAGESPEAVGQELWQAFAR